jgi:hypothetical protein
LQGRKLQFLVLGIQKWRTGPCESIVFTLIAFIIKICKTADYREKGRLEHYLVAEN